jgi:hypothetical protein
VTIEGYCGSVSYLAGQDLDLYLSTDGTPGDDAITVTRHAGTQTLTSQLHVGNRQAPSANAWEGYGWADDPAAPAAVIGLPNWPSGYYEVFASSGNQVGAFALRAASPASSVLVSVDMITYQAYDGTGGMSLYDVGRRAVSFDRPGGFPAGGRELPLLEWLNGEAIAADCCASPDLERPQTLDGYDCLIVGGHAEYWSRQMYETIDAFVRGGGNLVCLSGNTCFRQVRLENTGRKIVFYKFAGADPVGGLDASVAFADPPVNRPPNPLLGVGWTHGCFRSTGTAQPYQLHFPNHWAMAGIADTATLPFMGYETDAAAFVDEEDQGMTYPRSTGEDGTPLTFVALATADLRDVWRNPGAKPGLATAGVHRRNGTVFSAGTTDWIPALASSSAGPAVPQITRNVLARLRVRQPAEWEHVGHANGGRAMAAAEGRLFLATVDNRLWRRFPVAAEVNWGEIGHANDVVAMASDGAVLYAATADGQFWWRKSTEWNVNWTPIGTSPTGVTALACAGGVLYAADSAGSLHVRPASRAAHGWSAFQGSLPQRPQIVTLTAYRDILIAATDDGRLIRSNSDWIGESDTWTDITHCYFATGLAVVEATLFVATSESKLWALDLHGLRTP